MTVRTFEIYMWRLYFALLDYTNISNNGLIAYDVYSYSLISGLC